VTPTRLREIADRMERVCSNYQEKIGAGYMPCRGCQEVGLELRAFALAFEDGEMPKPGPMVVHKHNQDHQPAGPRDAA
jgi:hypothetical protein